MYEQDLFTKEGRFFHIGIDLGAPAGTEVFAFAQGAIINMGVNNAPGDYGPTLITEHDYEGRQLYALWGHLKKESLLGKTIGQKLEIGEQIAWLGDESENGGWPPHLHFQLSREKPEVCDMPGTVNDEDREKALVRFPDPRLVLGPIY
ncbi:MAG: hypothetical protein EOP11_26635 [Proteobacteria bacterium]|nr:MAG: hypothetical protein EOP11_26635 [Pseudomonadota bacterium]